MQDSNRETPSISTARVLPSLQSPPDLSSDSRVSSVYHFASAQPRSIDAHNAMLTRDEEAATTALLAADSSPLWTFILCH